MKGWLLFPVLAFVLLFVSACATSSRKRSEASETPGESLPPNCTLMAMTPQERELHKARLATLSRAASDLRKTDDGFTFSVNLDEMNLSELHRWAKDEQGCCSFLAIEARVIQPQRVAFVAVKCPEEFREVVLTTFGLATD